MPALSNARHELFAQALAKGETADAAYQKAGYRPNRGNAATLKANQSVEARVAELQGKSAERAVVTTESLIAEADEIKAKAMATAQLSAANAALTLKAKLAGKLVDRAEVGKPGDFERMTDDELAQFIAGEVADLGVGATGASASTGAGRVRGRSQRVH
jgi:phage terminase small subunit